MLTNCNPDNKKIPYMINVIEVNNFWNYFFSPALVLVTPDDEVKEGIDEVFRNVIAWTVLGPILVQG